MSGALPRRMAPVLWFTGLSGSGKTTVAESLKRRLEKCGNRVLVLDGDQVRDRLHRHLDFSVEGIKENNALIAGLCQRLRRDCDVILVPIISPFAVSRRHARETLGAGFYEVYFEVDLATVSARDPKGLYGKARRNEITNMIGVSPQVPYEPPDSADLVVHSSTETAEQSVSNVLDFVLERLEQSP